MSNCTPKHRGIRPKMIYQTDRRCGLDRWSMSVILVRLLWVHTTTGDYGSTKPDYYGPRATTDGYGSHQTIMGPDDIIYDYGSTSQQAIMDHNRLLWVQGHHMRLWAQRHNRPLWVTIDHYGSRATICDYGSRSQQAIMGHNRLLWVQTASYMPEDSAYPSHIPSLRQTRTVCLMYHRTAPPPNPLLFSRISRATPYFILSSPPFGYIWPSRDSNLTFYFILSIKTAGQPL